MSPHVERAAKIREAKGRLCARPNCTQHQCGTDWVAPGEGSTWQELHDAIDDPAHGGKGGWPSGMFRGGHGPAERGLYYNAKHKPNESAWVVRDERTNLQLTGAPLTEIDRERWESGNVC